MEPDPYPTDSLCWSTARQMFFRGDIRLSEALKERIFHNGFHADLIFDAEERVIDIYRLIVVVFNFSY